MAGAAGGAGNGHPHAVLPQRQAGALPRAQRPERLHRRVRLRAQAAETLLGKICPPCGASWEPGYTDSWLICHFGML